MIIQRIPAARLGAVVVALTACPGATPRRAPEPLIRLDVEGGPHAGRHTVVSAEVTCGYGLVGDGSWGTQYVDIEGRSRLGSLRLIVPDARAAAAGTGRFNLGIGFRGGVEHEIETRAAGGESGRGRVRIHDRGESGTVEIEGETGDGVRIRAVVSCPRVRRVPAPVRADGIPSGGAPPAAKR